MNRELVTELEDLNKQCRIMLDKGKTIIGNPKEIQFHMTIAKASDNLLIEAFLNFVIFYMENFKKLYCTDLKFSALVLKSHEMITDAIKECDNLRPSNLMQEHICDVETYMKESSKIISH